MRVALVHPGGNCYGGAELVIVRLAEYLKKRGVKVTLVTTDIPPQMREALPDIEVVIEPVVNKDGLALKDFWALKKALAKIEGAYDLVNIHNYPAELVSIFCRKPVVWLCNEPPRVALRYDDDRNFVIKAAQQLILRLDGYVVKHHITKAVVADEYNANRFKQIYSRDPVIIPYGIDYEFFSHGDGDYVREKYDLKDKFLILQVGMFTPAKNQIQSIQTFLRLKDVLRDAVLVFAGWGKGDYAEGVERYSKENNMSDRVVMTGHLERKAIKDLYHAADVLLHPIKPQGGWLAPFEAMCAKVPVVVSSEMTASDIIGKAKLGVVTEDFVSAVQRIYHNRKEYQNKATYISQWVRNNLSWDIFGEKMLETFRSIV